jgi:hypothetical protein
VRAALLETVELIDNRISEFEGLLRREPKELQAAALAALHRLRARFSSACQARAHGVCWLN